MKECQWRVTHNPEKEVQGDSEKKSTEMTQPHSTKF